MTAFLLLTYYYCYSTTTNNVNNIIHSDIDMSLNRISFLEGWDHLPAAFLRGRTDSASVQSDTESDSYEELPESPSVLSSSFPSTYSRLNFNPYAGPGWNESPVDDHDRPSLLGSRGLSPTTTRDSRVDPERRLSTVGTGVDPGPADPGFGSAAVYPKEPIWLSETTGAYEVSPAKRIGMPNLSSCL